MKDKIALPDEPIDYPEPPNALDAVKAYQSVDADKKTMTVGRFPIFLRQGLEALSRDAGRAMEHTVGAVLELGLPILRRFPGVGDCQAARQALLLHSRDPHVRVWLEQIVPLDIGTANLGDVRFVVRVDVGKHRQIGLLAGALGLHIGQAFTLALTAALVGSAYVPMTEANNAMYAALIDLRERCIERARYAGTLQHSSPNDVVQPRWTIHHVLGG